MAVHELFSLIEQSDVEGLTSALAGKASQSALDTLGGRVDGHDTALAGKANDNAVVHLSGTETIGGTKIFDLPPQIPVGSLLTHAVRRDDPRLTDARTPLSHGHNASDITAGTLDAARLPRVPWGTSTNTTTTTGSYALDLSSIPYPVRFKVIQNHNAGLNAPTGGVDGQVVKVLAYANSAERTFTFGSTIRLSTGLTTRTFTIPAGRALVAAIEYSSDMGVWILTAATVAAAA